MMLLSKSMDNLDWDWSDGRGVAEEEAAISSSHRAKPPTTTPSPPATTPVAGWRSSLFGDIFSRRKSRGDDEQEDPPLQEQRQRQQQQQRRQRSKSVDARHRQSIRQSTPKHNIKYVTGDTETDGEAPIRRLTLSSSNRTPRSRSFTHTNSTTPDGDDGSIISELTMMTYSAEEARLARSIMMSALQGGASNILLEQLSPEQRQTILQEVRLEKERQEEAKRQQIRSVNEQNEVFERLSQMRLQKQIEDECSDRHRRSCSTTDSPDEAAGGTSLNGAPSILDDHQDEVVEDDAQDSMMETLIKELRPKEPQKLNDVSPKSGGHKRRGSWGGFSFTSTRTPKHSNAKPAASSENEGGGDSGEDAQDSSVICDWTSSSSKGGEFTQSDVQEEEEANDEELPSSSTVDFNEPGIDEIIKLKLLLADQQATIDTLKSKSHKVEQTNHQLQDTNKEQQSQIKTLTQENQDLACQLNDSKQREGDLRKELSTNIKNSPFFKKLKAENQKLAAYVNEIRQREIDLRKECSIMLKHVSSITTKSTSDSSSSPTPSEVEDEGMIRVSRASTPTPRSPEFDDHDNRMEQAEVKSLGRAASFSWY